MLGWILGAITTVSGVYMIDVGFHILVAKAAGVSASKIMKLPPTPEGIPSIFDFIANPEVVITGGITVVALGMMMIVLGGIGRKISPSDIGRG